MTKGPSGEIREILVVVIEVAAMLLLLALLLAFVSWGAGVARESKPTWDNWLSRERAHRAMRFHGVNHMRIRDDRAEIWRRGQWVPVVWRGKGEQ